MLISPSQVVSTFSAVIGFFTTPRRLHALIASLTITMSWRISQTATVLYSCAPQSSLVHSAPLLLLLSAISFSVVAIASRVTSRVSTKAWPLFYTLVISLSVLPLIIEIHSFFRTSLEATLVLFVRLFLFVGVAESIVGFLVLQVSKRSQELTAHQDALVMAEEEFRKSVFDHLHDTVQSRLVVLGLQIDLIGKDVDSGVANRLRSITDELELMRNVDIRQFGNSISPQIEMQGLRSSFEILFDRYQRSAEFLDIAITRYDIGSESEEVFGLALYRIVEQSLLNGFMHGSASEFRVEMWGEGKSVHLRTFNNGHQFDPKASRQGHGSAVIDGWVQRFGGTWELKNLSRGVQLEAQLFQSN